MANEKVVRFLQANGACSEWQERIERMPETPPEEILKEALVERPFEVCAWICEALMLREGAPCVCNATEADKAAAVSDFILKLWKDFV